MEQYSNQDKLIPIQLHFSWNCNIQVILLIVQDHQPLLINILGLLPCFAQKSQIHQRTNLSLWQAKKILFKEQWLRRNQGSVMAESGNNVANKDVNVVTFNQDSSSLAIGTKTGYKLFSLPSVDKLEKVYQEENEDVGIVERLFSSSLVAVVSYRTPRKLRVCHIRRNTVICDFGYSNTILAVKLNRQRLIVCLEDSIYIHNIRDMQLLHTIKETPRNPKGLCALSASSEFSYLAYPASDTTGEVNIYDTIGNMNVRTIQVHDNPLVAMTFDSEGKRLATASDRVSSNYQVGVFLNHLKTSPLRHSLRNPSGLMCYWAMA